MKYRIVNRFRFITFSVVVIIMLTFTFVGILNTVNALDSMEEKYIEINVSKGDTLWEIAKEYGSQRKDIRETIYDICRLNGIKDCKIFPGQTIKIPYSDSQIH